MKIGFGKCNLLTCMCKCFDRLWSTRIDCLNVFLSGCGIHFVAHERTVFTNYPTPSIQIKVDSVEFHFGVHSKCKAGLQSIKITVFGKILIVIIIYLYNSLLIVKFIGIYKVTQTADFTEME